MEGRGEVLLDNLRAHVRRHDDNRVAEVDRTTLVVGQSSVVEHLQQDVEDIGVGLLDFIEQHDRVGLAPHGLGELSALVVTDVSRRRTDQTRDAVTLLVFAHVDSRHHRVVVEEELGQRLRQLGLAHTRRTEEDERTNRLARVVQSGTRAAHGVGDGGNGLVLAYDPLVKLLLHVEQLLALRSQHALYGDARPTRYHFGDILGVDLLLNHGVTAGRSQTELLLQGCNPLLGLLNPAVANLGHTSVVALTFGLLRLNLEPLDFVLVRLNLLQQVTLALPLGAQLRVLGLQLVDFVRQRLDTLLVVLAANRLALNFELADTAVERINLLRHRVHLEPQPRGGLVDQVDGLVGEEPRGDVTRREFDGGHNRLILDTHLMVVLVTLLQTAENRDGILARRLVDHHLLETAFKRLVLFEVLLVLVEGRGADGAQLAARQRRLEDVGGIHRTRRLAGTDQRVNLIDEEQNLALARNDLLHDGLQSLLELALILRAGNQRTHVERVNHLRLEVLGHVAVDNTVGNALGDGRLAHTGLTDQDRVVLRTARKNLQHAANLLVTPDNGVELARTSLLVEVDGVLTQCVELLRGGLRVDRRPLAEGADSLDELLLRCAVALEQLGDLTALGHERQQQVLDRRILVAEILREIDGALYDLRRILREILLTAALHPREGTQQTGRLLAQHLDIDAHTAQKEGRQRIVLAYQHAQQVHRLHGLLPPLLCKSNCSLQRLLRLDG